MFELLSILKGEVKHFGFVSGKKISLFAHFTKYVEKIAVAVFFFDKFDSDKDKHTYLRLLIFLPDMFFQILSKHG
jgi:hypothetical protein